MIRNDDSTVRLSIIIVNYNGKHFLDDCIRSIYQYVSASYEIVVVDNASVDGSCEYLETNYPDVRLVRSPVNSGFTGGNNLGGRHASGDYILLLNNDTKLKSDLSAALDVMEGDHGIGVVGGRLFYGDGSQQPSFGYDHTPLRICLSWAGFAKNANMPRIFRRAETSDEAYLSDLFGVAWVSGAFLFTRKALWQRLGGLDQAYFMYMEDVDYCKRVRELGYRVDYISTIECIHYEGAGRPWIGERALLNTMRSYLRYVRKFHGWCGVAFVKCTLVPIMLLRGTFYVFPFLISREGRQKEKLIGFFRAAKTICFFLPKKQNLESANRH